MDIQSLTNLFSQITGIKIYNLQFPEDCLGEAIKLEMTSGLIDSGGVKDFNVQFMVKAEHPSGAEQLALQLINKLHKVTNRYFGPDESLQLILCYCQTPTPSFVGELTSGEFVYSVDFRLLVG